jgi:hypothetical protein
MLAGVFVCIRKSLRLATIKHCRDFSKEEGDVLNMD